MIHLDTHSRTSVRFALALALTAPAAGLAQFGQTFVASTSGGSAAATPGTTPTAFEFVRRGSRRLPKAGVFLPALDTPRFENRGIGEDSGGICYGMALITMDWYRKVVHPLETQSYLNYAAGGNGKVIQGIFGETQPIRRENMADYRLQTYTRARENAERVARHAIQFQDDQFVVPRDCATGCDAESKKELVDAYLGDAEWSAALVAIFNPDRSSGHALVVHRAYEGVARNSRGTAVRAIKYQVYDPNFSEVRRRTPDTYLLYFPDEKKWGIPPSFENLYSSVQWQQGPYLAENQLVVHRPDHLLSGVYRSIQNWWEDNRSSTISSATIRRTFNFRTFSPRRRAD